MKCMREGAQEEATNTALLKLGALEVQNPNRIYGCHRSFCLTNPAAPYQCLRQYALPSAEKQVRHISIEFGNNSQQTLLFIPRRTGEGVLRSPFSCSSDDGCHCGTLCTFGETSTCCRSRGRPLTGGLASLPLSSTLSLIFTATKTS